MCLRMCVCVIVGMVGGGMLLLLVLAVSTVPVVQSEDSGHKPAPEALCLALGWN